MNYGWWGELTLQQTLMDVAACLLKSLGNELGEGTVLDAGCDGRVNSCQQSLVALYNAS